MAAAGAAPWRGRFRPVPHPAHRGHAGAPAAGHPGHRRDRSAPGYQIGGGEMKPQKQEPKNFSKKPGEPGGQVEGTRAPEGGSFESAPIRHRATAGLTDTLSAPEMCPKERPGVFQNEEPPGIRPKKSSAGSGLLRSPSIDAVGRRAQRASDRRLTHAHL
jgi:hypothetical protein